MECSSCETAHLYKKKILDSFANVDLTLLRNCEVEVFYFFSLNIKTHSGDFFKCGSPAGVQRHRQPLAQRGGHQDHRPGGGRGRNRGHPAGDHRAEPVRQSLHHQVLRLLPQSENAAHSPSGPTAAASQLRGPLSVSCRCTLSFRAANCGSSWSTSVAVLHSTW